MDSKHTVRNHKNAPHNQPFNLKQVKKTGKMLKAIAASKEKKNNDKS